MANDAMHTTTEAAPTATPTSKPITQFTCYDSMLCAWWVVLLLLTLPLAGLIAPSVFTPGVKTAVALLAGLTVAFVWKWDFRELPMAVAGLLVPGLVALTVYVAASQAEWMSWLPAWVDALSINDPALLTAAGLLTLLIVVTAARDRMLNTWLIQGAELVNSHSGKHVAVSTVTKTGTGYSVHLLTATAGPGDRMEAITTLGWTGEVQVGDHTFSRVFHASRVAAAINAAATAAAVK